MILFALIALAIVIAVASAIGIAVEHQREMDGRAIEQAFKAGYLEGSEAVYRPAGSPDTPYMVTPQGEPAALSELELGELGERLSLATGTVQLVCEELSELREELTLLSLTYLNR